MGPVAAIDQKASAGEGMQVHLFLSLFLSSLIATDTAYARGRIGEKALRDALKGASHTSMRRKE
jgi:hypothetical protein